MFTQTAIDVLCRNHADDVKRLNQVLSTTGTGTLVPIPPHTYVGRVESRQPEVPCVLLLGINPMYSERPEHQKVNVHLPQRCLAAYQASGDVEDLRDLYEFQEGYFLREERNTRHFSKFGNWFRHPHFQRPTNTTVEETPKCTTSMWLRWTCCSIFVAVIDGIASSRRSYRPSTHRPLASVGRGVAKMDKPQWIQVDGKTCWKVMAPC